MRGMSGSNGKTPSSMKKQGTLKKVGIIASPGTKAPIKFGSKR